MKTLYRYLSPLSIWAAEHHQLVRFLLFCIGTFVVFSGYYMGVELYRYGYSFAVPMLLSVFAVWGFLFLVLPVGKRRRNGKRKGASRRYFEHIIHTSAIAYGAFWISVAAGNNYTNSGYVAATQEWHEISLQRALDEGNAHTAVIRGLQPAKAKISKKSKAHKSPKQTQAVHPAVFIVLGILCFLFTLAAGVLSCLAGCSGAWGWFALALFSTFAFLAGTVVFFVLAGKGFARRRRELNNPSPEPQPTPKQPIDVVYLKNGSILKGLVLEANPTGNIKIQTADGSIFVYKMEEVERMTKEE